MGVPVVASRTGGIPEMAPEGEGTRLCEAGNAEEFQRTIEKLIDDPASRRQLAAAGRLWAVKHYAAATAGETYATMFRAMIQQRHTDARPISAEELLAASELPQIRLDTAIPGSVAAFLRFIQSMMSPRHAAGNLRTLALYWKLQRNTAASRELAALFDAAYYTTACPDAAPSGISPLWHYLLCGFWQGYDPSPKFHTRYYLTAYRDIAHTVLNPLLHYVASGRAEGRTGQPDYDLA